MLAEIDRENKREREEEGETRGLRNNEIKDSMVRECALYSVRTGFIYVRSSDLSDSFSTVTCLAFPRDGFKLRTRATPFVSLSLDPFLLLRYFLPRFTLRLFLSICFVLSPFRARKRINPGAKKSAM